MARKREGSEGPSATDIPTEAGWVAPAVAEELPGIGLTQMTVERRVGRSPRIVRERLRELSNRFYGSHAIQLRSRPIPWAYRTFFRQIGLDPDHTRTPVEEAALNRMKRGHFRSSNQLDDALTIGIVETGVAVRAFDGAKLEGQLGIRTSAPGERLEGRPGELPSG